MKRIVVLAIVALSVCLGWSTAPVSAEEPIVIGIPTSLTAIEGKESVNAVKLAVDEINAKGGVKVGAVKRPFKIETIDLRDSSPGVRVDEALLGLEKIITEKKPAAIVVGPFRSEALLAGMELLAKYKVPMLGTIAMSPLSEQKVKENPEKYKYCFRVSLNAKYAVGCVGNTLAFMNKEFGFNKLFVMTQDVLWAKATGGGAAGQAKKSGYTVVGQEAYPTGSSDFAAGLSKVKAQGAHVIMPIFDMPQSGILINQWKSMKVPAMVFGYISPMTGPGGWKTFKGGIGGLLEANWEIGSGIPASKYPPSAQFFDAYQKKFGMPVESGHGPAPSYDAVYILAEAIERAGTLDPDKLVAEIKKTDRKGAVGRIKFDDGNQVIYGDDPNKAACACVFQWTDDGKRVIVYPESIAEAKIRLPEWVKPAK